MGNTLGHDNYKYFIALLCVHVVAGTMWEITALYLYSRVRASWLMTWFMIYSALWMLMILTLLNYHLYIMSLNLTTNEYINSAKYPHFRDEYDDFNNPFNYGNASVNIIDGLFPSSQLLYTRKDAITVLRRGGCSSEGCNHCEQGDSQRDIEEGEMRGLLANA